MLEHMLSVIVNGTAVTYYSLKHWNFSEYLFLEWYSVDRTA